MRNKLHKTVWISVLIFLTATCAMAQLAPIPGAVQQSTGLNGAITAMAVYDDKLVIGGHFTEADGMLCKGLVTWDGTAFDTIPGTPSGLSGFNRINTLLQAENSLYVGGDFPTLDFGSGPESTGHIVRYTGTDWERMLTNTTHASAAATSGPVKCLVFHEDKLYVGGDFTTVDVNGDDVAVGNLATYDWNSTPLWDVVGTSGLSGNSQAAEAMTLWDDKVLIVGRFEAADGIDSRNMVVYDEVLGFISINTGSFTGQIGRARSVAIQDGKVYVGGDYNNIGQNNLFGLNAYDGTDWLGLNADIGIDRRTLYACDEDYIWVGGNIEEFGSDVNNLFVYDVANDEVLPFSDDYWGVDGIVNAIVEFEGELYVAGEFDNLMGSNGQSDISFNNIFKVSNFCDSEETGINPPANNECASAQSLSVPTFPSSSNTLGTLYGATNEGGTACTGSAVGGDVFYSFTLSAENHVGIAVNPFDGADAVVEVLDACSGNTIACIDDAGAGSSENELLENLAAGTYTVRVHNAGGSPEPEASASFMINVQQMPYAQVQDNPNSSLYACNQTGFQLEDFVGASPQTTSWVLDYEWLSAEEGGGVQTVYQRGEPNYVSRCEWLGMEYGKTYNVFVRVLIDHPVFGPIWSVFPGDYNNPNDLGASFCTISTSANVTPTELRPNYSPTNVAGNDYSMCDMAIAYNVQNSENFRWRFDPDMDPNNSNEIIYTRGAGNPSVRLSWVSGLIPGLTYNVAVEVQVAGQWSGYSTVLPLNLSLPPNDVTLRNPYCGGTYAPNGYILSQSVCDADFYAFEFENVSTSSIHTRNTANYVCFLSGVTPALTPGDYNVRVKVTQNGVPGDFGPSCVITISGPVAPESGVASMRSLEAANSATLFPNPNAGSEVRVQLDGLSDGNHDVNILVYDIYGKLISIEGFGHEGKNLSRLVRFNSRLSLGLYMVQILVDGERFATNRLIVK